MRVQNYEHLKNFPLQDIERLWRQNQLCDDWFRYYCWEWRNSTVRYSNLYKHWEGKPAPCPKPVDGTNFDT